MNLLTFLWPVFADGFGSLFVWRCQSKIHNRRILFDKLAPDSIAALRRSIIICRHQNTLWKLIPIVFQRVDLFTDFLRQIFLKIRKGFASLFRYFIMRAVGHSYAVSKVLFPQALTAPAANENNPYIPCQEQTLISVS